MRASGSPCRNSPPLRVTRTGTQRAAADLAPTVCWGRATVVAGSPSHIPRLRGTDAGLAGTLLAPPRPPKQRVGALANAPPPPRIALHEIDEEVWCDWTR